MREKQEAAGRAREGCWACCCGVGGAGCWMDVSCFPKFICWNPHPVFGDGASKGVIKLNEVRNVGYWADGRRPRRACFYSCLAQAPRRGGANTCEAVAVRETSWEISPETECLGLWIWNFYFSHTVCHILLWHQVPSSAPETHPTDTENIAAEGSQTLSGYNLLPQEITSCKSVPSPRVWLIANTTWYGELKAPKCEGSSQLQTSL